MKTLLFSFLAVAAVWATPLHASQFLPSNITEVTLFSDQALVERTCRTEVTPGLNRLLLEITAFAVDKDSVSAQVFGHGEILGVQTTEIHLTEFPQDQVQALEERLRQLMRSRTTLSDRKIVLGKKEAFLNSLIDFSKTQLPKEVQTRFPDIQDLKDTVAYIGTELASIQQETQTLDDAIQEVDRDIERTRKELDAVRGGLQRAKQGVEVLYRADRNEAVRLHVQYLVQSASWKPVYRVAAPLDLSAVDMTMLAGLSQKSGEDWDQVKLSISNAIPLKGVRLPELESWLIDLPRPPVPLRKSMLMKTESGAVAESRQADAPAGAPVETAAEYAAAVARELPFSFEYTLPFPVDIASRGTSSLLPIFSKKLSGDFFHCAIPKKSALTFLVCETKADRELLAGPLSLYFGGRYIGETHLAETKAGQPFQLNLGADRGVKVRREKLTDKVKETYFGSIQRDTVVREFAYKITAENVKPTPVKLTIEDSVPVSKTDKIEVRDVKITPEPAQRNYRDKAGVMQWELDLAPGEKKEILISFTVSYPAESPPFGL